MYSQLSTAFHFILIETSHRDMGMIYCLRYILFIQGTYQNSCVITVTSHKDPDDVALNTPSARDDELANFKRRQTTVTY